MTVQVSLNGAKELVTQIIRERLVPMVFGSPAIGKSSIVHQIASEYNLKVIDLRLSQCDPTELSGFPKISLDGNKAGYVPMDTFPIEGDDLPEGYDGWILFLDEFNSAPRAVQAAAYKLVLDRMVGLNNLHPKVAVVAAGNMEDDGAITEEMSTAMQSRLISMQVEIKHSEWIDWATANGIDHRITSFIKFKPGQLYTFSPTHTDMTYASPRTWEFANRFVKRATSIDHKMIPLLSGTISEGTAREFVSFCQIYTELPTIQDIITQPETLAVPGEPSILYALTGAISHNAKEDNIEPLMKYVSRLPIEFQIVTLREIVRRHKPLLSSPPVSAWISKNSAELF